MNMTVTHCSETSTPNPNRSTKPQDYDCSKILFEILRVWSSFLSLKKYWLSLSLGMTVLSFSRF